MSDKAIRFSIFFLVVFIATSQAKTPQPVSLGSTGGIPVDQSTGNGSAITDLWNGYRLHCPLQSLWADVTVDGLEIHSTSKQEGVATS